MSVALKLAQTKMTPSSLKVQMYKRNLYMYYVQAIGINIVHKLYVAPFVTHSEKDDW